MKIKEKNNYRIKIYAERNNLYKVVATRRLAVILMNFEITDSTVSEGTN